MTDDTTISPVLLHRMYSLQADQTLWDLRDIQRALGLSDRTSMHYLRQVMRNYSERGLRQWPPVMPALRKLIEVPQGQTPARLTRWPAHPHVLPPPLEGVGDSSNPLWYAGDIVLWAMKTGRMALDGTPILLKPHGPPRTPDAVAPVDLSTVDFDAYRRLVDDDTPWSMNDIAAELEINVSAVRHWYTAARNLSEGGDRSWPPEFKDSRTVADDASGTARLLRWPPHHRVLPLPDRIEGRSPIWSAGGIRLWAMKTGRMALDGTLIPDAFRSAA